METNRVVAPMAWRPREVRFLGDPPAVMGAGAIGRAAGSDPAGSGFESPVPNQDIRVPTGVARGLQSPRRRARHLRTLPTRKRDRSDSGGCSSKAEHRVVTAGIRVRFPTVAPEFLRRSSTDESNRFLPGRVWVRVPPPQPTRRGGLYRCDERRTKGLRIRLAVNGAGSACRPGALGHRLSCVYRGGRGARHDAG